MREPPCLVVMGVSGCGKTTLGTALARALAVTFVEGDTLHPQVDGDLAPDEQVKLVLDAMGLPGLA